MSKKLYALLLPVLCLVALAGVPTIAQAQPEWEVCEHVGAGNGEFKDSECELAEAKGPWGWKLVGNAEHKVQVVTFGKLSLTIGTTTITCKVLDGGNIWNAGGIGKDEILAFTNYECSISPEAECKKGLELVAEKLPWSSKLVAGISDEITGINVRFKCAEPVVNLLFTGTLKPKFVSGHPSFFEFTAATGELEEVATGIKAKVTGKDNIITQEGREVRAK